MCSVYPLYREADFDLLTNFFIFFKKGIDSLLCKVYNIYIDTAKAPQIFLLRLCLFLYGYKIMNIRGV